VRKGVKRVLLIAFVIAGFVAFDSTMDYLARHFYPNLFSFVLYPIDVAGAIEYSVGATVLYVSMRKSVEWLNTGTIACFVFSFLIIAQKLIFRA
jgi:hypothetical protein